MIKGMTLGRERAALIVIDIQERLAGVMDAGRMAEVTRNCCILIEAARRFQLPIVVSAQYPKGLGPTVQVLRDALRRVDDLTRLEKTDFSVCATDAFAERATELRASGRDQWLVTGMETHICVYQSVRALRAHGDSVHLVSDAVASRSQHNLDIGLGLAERCGAVLSSTETVVMDLLGCARGEDFKAISKLIR